MATVAAVPNREFSPDMLADPSLYGDEPKLTAFLAWLLAENPVARAEPEGYRPFWIIAKFADIREIERQPETFVASPRTVLFPIAVEEANRKYLGNPNGGTSLVQLDGEKHRTLRALTQDWFLPKNLRPMREKVEALANQFIDRMIASGPSCDFAADVAFWYPLRVAMTILGLPPEDEPYLLRLAQEMFAFQDPEFAREGVPTEELLLRIREDYYTYFEAVTEDRRAHPREDVSTIIANAKVDGDYMDPVDRISYYTIIASAGHDTTAASIAGAALALIRDPAEWARIRANPGLCATLADEAIRYTAPVKHFMRTATSDYELRGQTIRKGDSMVLAYSAGCRDPEIFPEPDRFIVDRAPNNHLAFGYGPHACLGQYLAKMEIEVFFRTLVKRIAKMELAGNPEYAESSFVSGLKRLPIRFQAT